MLKRQRATSLNEAKALLTRLAALKLQGEATTQDHQEWLYARKVVLEEQAFDIDRVRLLAKEKLLSKDNASPTFFFRALKIKNKQSLIKILKDDLGNEVIGPNVMANIMLTYLSQIIGQEEVLSKEVIDAQDRFLQPVKRGTS